MGEAVKYDGDKPMLGLVPLRASIEVGKVATYGGKKYAVGNWHEGDSFNYGRLLDAGRRHVAAFELGEDTDPESGLPHLAHASWCFMACLELALTGHGVDDRGVRQFLPGFEPVSKLLPERKVAKPWNESQAGANPSVGGHVTLELNPVAFLKDEETGDIIVTNKPNKE